ncbi:MAG: hypothetical protein WDA16_07730 [Candidatus Thermoplasmatota archaeon]
MRKQLIAIATLVALSMPTALGWGMLGSYEPDTKLDTTGGWMYGTTDVSSNQAVRKVYFNGFYGQCYYNVCEPFNPNVAAVRSGVHSTEYLQYAMLGVWKDCNKDGYVGLGDRGWFEYRAELLLDVSVCPKQTLSSTIPRDWFPFHNDGVWVKEFLSIQWNDYYSLSAANIYDVNPWNINDNGARVWADHGLAPAYSIGCYYTSFPVGTFRSTGGLLHTVDCVDSYRVTDTFDTVADSNANTKPLSFSDAPRDQANSDSTLNEPNPWGNEREDDSYVQVWDCTKPSPLHAVPNTPPGTPVSNTVGENAGSDKSSPTYRVLHVDSSTDYNVSMPKVPPSATPSGSAAGTMNATGSGFDHCTRNQQHDSHNHMGDSLAGLPYDESATTETPARTQPDDAMRPWEQGRPAAPYAGVLGKSSPGGTSDKADGDLGLHVTSTDGVWSGNRVWHQETVFTGSGGVAPVKYETYYAFVSTASTYGLSLPKGTAMGTYGSEACGTSTTGIKNGWDCDKTHWYKDALGDDLRPRSHYLGPDPNPPPNTICAYYSQQSNPNAGCLSYGALPGDSYNMKDIDCYDQSVQQARAAGVGYGLLTGTKCDIPT